MKIKYNKYATKSLVNYIFLRDIIETDGEKKIPYAYYMILANKIVQIVWLRVPKENLSDIPWNKKKQRLMIWQYEILHVLTIIQPVRCRFLMRDRRLQVNFIKIINKKAATMSRFEARQKLEKLEKGYPTHLLNSEKSINIRFFYNRSIVIIS